jgi:hypothetical protein
VKTELENKETIALVIRYKSGQTNVHETNDKDLSLAIEKLFKWQNYMPEKVVISEAILIKEI